MLIPLNHIQEVLKFKKWVFGNEECNNDIFKIKIIDIYNIIEEIPNSLINEKTFRVYTL